MGPTMTTVFVSYSHKDADQASRVVEALKDADFDVFWDRRVDSGDKWRRTIETHLNAADCVLVLWTSHSVESDWVIEEANLAKDRGTLLPYRIGDVRVPFGFGEVQAQALQFSGNQLDATSRALIAAGVARALDRRRNAGAVDDHPVASPPLAGDEPAPASTDSAAQWVGVGAILAVLAVPVLITLSSLDGESDKSPLEATVSEPEPELPDFIKLPVDADNACFMMGSDHQDAEPAESPVHQVCVPSFFISREEVTFAQYDAFVDEHSDVSSDYLSRPLDNGWGRNSRPVIYVSWSNAVRYAQWLGERMSMTCHLPTEAQWEYAARGDTTTPWYWGDHYGSATHHAWHAGNTQKTQPVGTRIANAFGLKDMAGNVYEWVQDCWHDHYNGAPTDGSAWEQDGGGDCSKRVIRGGYYGGYHGFLRSAHRDSAAQNKTLGSVGFRVACHSAIFDLPDPASE